MYGMWRKPKHAPEAEEEAAKMRNERGRGMNAYDERKRVTKMKK